MMGEKRISREEVAEAVGCFLRDEAMPAAWQDHALTGEWTGYREFHLSGAKNNLVVYKRLRGVVILVNLGTHEELFAHRKWKKKGVKNLNPTLDEVIEDATEAGRDALARAARALKRWWQQKG